MGAALASEGVRHEILVLDDGSEDKTAAIVRAIADLDPRVSLVFASPLSEDWCGKQRACSLLAERASYERLLFLDADVTVAPDAAARAIAFLESSQADLISGIPLQKTETLAERLVIPLIHFILLGFLPFSRMRRNTHPAYAAGCGQFVLTTRRAYRRAGGHAAIRHSLHDGVMLPRAYRRAGMQTDLFDATDLATCRMYRGAHDVWLGLQKNAIEGLAAPRVIVPFSAVLALGQIVPWAMLLLAISSGVPPAVVAISVITVGLSLIARVALLFRFRQSWIGAALHPLGVFVLLCIQWTAFSRWLCGLPVRWKGRGYSHGPSLFRLAGRLVASDVKTGI